MRRKRWLRRAGLAVVVLLAAAQGFSLLLRTNRLHRHLTSRLAATFGRPVEVSFFEMSLLSGPRLEAHFITLAEDPRFGHEYFLRAERMTASVRWRSLLRGRFEFGTLSLTRPSLNLVRVPDGRWNLESWLPPPAAVVRSAAAGDPLGQTAGRLYRIEVDTGRINFKRGADKHPFALVEVNGTVDQESGGRWRLDLEARAVRAAVAVQEAGTLRVRGRVGGTSARLRPADLQLTWQEASLADALRLVRGQDYGIRGQVSLELTARTHSPGRAPADSSSASAWSFTAAARLRNVHRWDLPQRPGDPSLNLVLEARWWPEQARVELTSGVLEAPSSSIRASGFLQWAPPAPQAGGNSGAQAAGDCDLRFISSGISLNDLLAWYRAFRPGVAEEAALEGNAGLNLELRGWPPRLAQGVLATDGARWRAAREAAPVGIARAVVRTVRGEIELAPVVFTFPPLGEPRRPAATFRVHARASPGRAWKFELDLAGQTDRAEQVLATASALGWSPLGAWSVEGSAGLKLRWQGSLSPLDLRPAGSAELRNARLRAAFLNQPVAVSAARVEFGGPERPGGASIALASAQAFGARWSGSLLWKGPGAPWEVSLAADRLDVVELDRWLNPRWRRTLFQRVVPFRAADRGLSALDSIRASGRLGVEQVLLPRLTLRRVRARVEVTGRALELAEAQADFCGGVVRGSFRAAAPVPEGAAEPAGPAYRFEGGFERVSLAELSGAAPSLAGRFAGVASGKLTLAARGTGRENLVRSLEGRGSAGLREVQLRGLDLWASLDGALRQSPAAAAPGASEFRTADAAFVLSAGKLLLEKLTFSSSSPAAELETQGSVDFSRALDLRIHVRPPATPSRIPRPPAPLAGRTFRLTGPLDAPRVTLVEPPPR